MKLGFTGTRYGISAAQVAGIHSFLILHKQEIEEAHMGDCIGADQAFYDACYIHRIKTIGHPPSAKLYRAFCKYDIEMPLLPYLERNHKIVEACNFLLVVPKSNKEEQRSGTWATLRYATKLEKQIRIIFPDGQQYSYAFQRTT